MNKKHEVHPVASLFPMMDDVSFQALKEDIKTHGQLEPILYWKNMLVDGRNRLRACEELNIEPREVELMDETDPVAYVISHNLHRRHLTESQRAMVAGKLAKLKHGEVGNGRKVDGQICPSTKEASKMLNVSEGSTKHAKKVIADGASKVQQAVVQGELPVSVAAEFVKAVPDKEQQTKLMEDGVDTVRDAIKTIAQDDEPVFSDVDDEPVPKRRVRLSEGARHNLSMMKEYFRLLTKAGKAEALEWFRRQIELARDQADETSASKEKARD